jgi:hypothetical protein
MTETVEARETRPPSWLTRAERRAFQRMVETGFGADKSISAARSDVLADYVQSRSRIAALTRAWRAAARDADGYPPSERHVIALSRQLDATVGLSRRLARELGLD